MGFFTETLRLVLDADMQGGVRNVEQFGDKSEKEFARSEKALDKWGNRLTSVGAGMIGFGAVALFGLGKAAQASEEAQLSVVKLENTLRNMPKLAGANSKEFIDLAGSIQDVTAADADAIVEGQALLGTFNLTAKEIKGITPLVVDYARKFGTDIPDAAIQVGKALDGQVGALKRNGVSIDETLFKTDKYRAVQEALADQVGGFAEDEGKTFAGSLERLKNQLGDVIEGVGSGAVDAFTDLFDAVDPLIDRFNNLDPAVQGTIGKVATFGAVAVIAAGGASVLIGQIIKAHDNFTTAFEAAKRLAGSEGISRVGTASLVAAGQIGILILAAEGVSRLFAEERANIDKLENSLLKLGDSHKVSGELARIMGEDLDDLKEAVDHVIDPSGFQEFSHALDEIASGGGLIPNAKDDLDDFKARIDDVDKALAQLASRSPQEAAASLDVLLDLLGLSGDEADRFVESLDDYNAALARADTANRVASDGMGGTITALGDQAEEAEAAKTALEEYENQLNALFDPLFGYVDALQSNLEAQDAVTRAQVALDEAITEHGATSVEAANATAELEQAHIDAARSAMDMDLALQDLTTAVETGEVSVSEATAKLQQWVAQGLITQQSADVTAAKFFGLTGAIQTTPDGKQIHVSALGAESVLGVLSAVKRAVDGIRDADVAISVGGGVKVRDFGGPVTEGTPYWVGVNKRPELFVPNSDGHIFTEQQLAAAQSNGGFAAGLMGGRVDVGVTFDRTGDRLMDAIMDGLRVRVQQNFGGNVQAALGWSRR